MKKKITLMLLALVCAIACAFGLAACGGGGGGGDEGSTKNVEYTTVTYAGDYLSNYNAGNKTFTFDAGTEVRFSASDFNVVVTYTDGSTKTLETSEYTVDASSLPSDGVLDDNTYYVSVYEQSVYYFSEQFAVTAVSQKLDVLSFEDTIKFTYDGQEKNIIAKLDEMQIAEGKQTITKLLNDGLVKLGSEETTRTDAGQYYLTLSPAPGYTFGNANGNSYINVNWYIEKARIPVPVVKVNGVAVAENEAIELTYKHKLEDGNYVGVEQGIELDFGSFDTTALNGVIQIENDRGTNSQTYYCTVNIIEDYRDNYTFDLDNSNYNYNYYRYWSIAPMKIKKPEIVSGSDAFVIDDNGHYRYTYTGNEIAPEFDFDGLEDLFVVSGEMSGTDVTGNEIDLSFKDDTTRYNYKWLDGSDVNMNYSFWYWIDRADYVLPSDINENLMLEITFTDMFSFSFNEAQGESSFTAETIAYIKANNLEDGDFSWSSQAAPTIEHVTAPGQYIEAQLDYVKSNNYNKVEGLTVKIKVNPKQVVIDNVYWEKDDHRTNYFNNQPKTNSISNFYNIRPYNIELEIESTKYYKKDLNNEYQQVESCVSAGEYKTVVTFVLKDEDKRGDYFVDPIEKEWTIEKSKLQNPWFNWSGTAIDTSVNPYSYGYLSLVEEDTPQSRTIIAEPTVYTEYMDYYNQETKIEGVVSCDSYDYYKYNGTEWTKLSGESEIIGVGKYKVTAYISYDLSSVLVKENRPLYTEIDFEIVSRTIDVSTATWEDKTEFEYGAEDKYPKAIVPTGTRIANYHFYSDFGDRYNNPYGGVGNYQVTAEIEVIPVWKDEVTLTGDNPLGARHDYRINSHHLTESDFVEWGLYITSSPERIDNTDGGCHTITGLSETKFNQQINNEYQYLTLLGDYRFNVDIVYVTTALEEENCYRTTATITINANSANSVTMDGESMVVYIDWTLAE